MSKLLISFLAYQVILYSNTIRLRRNDPFKSAFAISANLCSFINALFSTCFAGLALYETNFSNLEESYYFSSPSLKTISECMIGYFLSDLVYLILLTVLSNKLTKNNMMYFVHHIVFSSILLWISGLNKYHYLVYYQLLTEFSSVVMGVFNYCRYYAKFYKTLAKYFPYMWYNFTSYIVFILFVVSFFVVRIVLTIWLFATYFDLICNDEPMLFLFAVFILGLNVIWLKELVLAVIRFRYV
jgi:hypothetical protein